MNAVTLLGHIPVADWLGLICSIAIPYISALLTKHPGHLTGLITAALASVNGVLADLATEGNVTWKAAGVALLSWLVATKWHGKVLAGTSVEDDLHATGTKPAK